MKYLAKASGAGPDQPAVEPCWWPWVRAKLQAQTFGDSSFRAEAAACVDLAFFLLAGGLRAGCFLVGGQSGGRMTESGSSKAGISLAMNHSSNSSARRFTFRY